MVTKQIVYPKDVGLTVTLKYGFGQLNEYVSSFLMKKIGPESSSKKWQEKFGITSI